MLLCFYPIILEHFRPASTLLHEHLALATLSPPETDPQTLERWGFAADVHFGKSFRVKDFGLECLRDVQRFSVKSMKTSAALHAFDESYITGLAVLSYSSCVFIIATTLVSPFFLDLLLGCSSTCRCA